jgi:glycosyltransferase involved in cell wall biosynthesis
LHLGDPDNPRDPVRRAYTARPFRSLLRSADGVFVQTERELNAVLDLGVHPDRSHLQGLGVDSNECTGGDRSRARADWDLTESEIVIGHLANNSAEKGTVDLVRASERLWSRDQQFRLVLAGPEMPSFRRFISGVQSDRITRLGWLSDQARRDFFAGIDVLVLPSRSDSFGLVLLEAWANGVPVVVYRAGGPAELVRHGIDGLQAACGDVESLADQLERMIIDADLRAECGFRGRERVNREFRWDDKLELFRKKIGPGRQPGPLGDFAEVPVREPRPSSAL